MKGTPERSTAPSERVALLVERADALRAAGLLSNSIEPLGVSLFDDLPPVETIQRHRVQRQNQAGAKRVTPRPRPVHAY